MLQEQNMGLSQIFSICVSATSHAYGAQKGQKVFNQLRTNPILKYGPENITLTLLYIEKLMLFDAHICFFIFAIEMSLSVALQRFLSYDILKRNKCSFAESTEHPLKISVLPPISFYLNFIHHILHT